MRRSRLETLLHDYVAGDLDAQQRAEAEALIESDAPARALYDEVRAAHEALQCLRERPEPPVSAADAFPRIQAALTAGNFADRPQLYLEGQGTRFYRRIALAATVLFAVSVGLFAVNRFASDNETATPQPVVRDTRPTANERGLERLVELGHRKGGIDAVEYLRRLKEVGLKPEEAVIAPMYNAIPVSGGAVDDR